MNRYIEIPVTEGAISQMEEHPEGPWVRYDDVIKMEKQLKHFIDKEAARELHPF